MDEKVLKKYLLNNFINVHSPGYVIGIFKNNEFFQYVVGNKCVKPKVLETTENTLYDLASLTKVFTATLVYMAYEEGLLDLNQSVYSVNNNFVNLKDVTILNLLSHNQEVYTDGYLGDSLSKEDFYERLYSAYVKSNDAKYVDIHYIILSTILENVYNKSYKDLVTEKIIKRLNLKNTKFDPNENECASCNYEYQDSGLVTDLIPGTIHDKKARRGRELGIYTGHAGIFSVCYDMFIFLKSFLDGSLIKKETIDIMLKYDDNHNYNYMSCRRRKDLNKVLYSFSDKAIIFSGYTGPMFVLDFERKVIIIVMCNTLHNTHLKRKERKKKTEEIIGYIAENM